MYANNVFAIIYAAGVDKYGLSYYLDRYSTSGNRLSHEQVPGECYYYQAYYTRLFWMGSKYGIFFYGNVPDDYNRYMRFCTADSSGNPGSVLSTYYTYPVNSSMYWSGKNFLVVSGSALSSFEPKGIFQLLTFKSNGQILGSKTTILNTPLYSCTGVGLIPLKKKNTYMLIFSGRHCSANPALPPPPGTAFTTRGDYFTGSVKAKNKKVGDIKLANGTDPEGYSWTNPSGLKIGNRYFVAGGHGCGIVFAEFNSKGKVIRGSGNSPARNVNENGNIGFEAGPIFHSHAG